MLIGPGEALAAAEVAFDLHEAGWQVHIYAADPRHSPLRFVPGAVLHHVGDPRCNLDQTLDDLRALWRSLDQPWCMPLDDGGVFVVNRLVQNGDMDETKVVGPTGRQAALALDKCMQIEQARQAGLHVPTTRVVHHPEQLSKDVMLPCVVKPAMAVSERDNRLTKAATHLCENAEALQRASERLTPGVAMLVQPWLSGVGEGVFALRGTAGDCFGMNGHRRLRMMNPHGSGSSACQSLTPDAQTAKSVRQLVRNIDWQGLFMVELLRDADGKLWFMELNGRAWGSMALSLRQGFHYPRWALEQCATAGPFQPDVPSLPSVDAPPWVARHLGRELVHLAMVLRGPKSELVRRDWPRWWRSAAAVLHPPFGEAVYNYRSYARRVVLMDTWRTLRRTLGSARSNP